MTLSEDHILDRRRMRRKLTFWRVLTFVVVAVALLAIIGSFGLGGTDALSKRSAHIARIPITGFIANSRYAMEQLEKIRKDTNVKAVIISVDSPGGTTVGGELLHKSLRAIGDDKPMVTSIGGLAASAGYMVAVAADHIVAPRTAIIGSVGVILQYPNATELLAKLGVSVEEIKSSPLKAEPSPFNATPAEARTMLEAMLLDTYTWFADLVKERRGFTDSEAEPLVDGSVFTGQQALNRKLIDEIGDETIAKKWLVSQKDINKDLPIVTWSLAKPPEDFLLARAIFHSVASMVGLSDVVSAQRLSSITTPAAGLDGFLSVWQAGVNIAE
ncbi:MAG: signal peptide peptidase SppA [Pseudomonadota bacterium]